MRTTGTAKGMGRWLALVATLSVVPGCFFLLLISPKTTAANLPDRPGKAVYIQRCSSCHALIEPVAFRAKLGEIVYRYRDKKVITANEQRALFDYLSTFPDADGKELPPPTPTPVPADVVESPSSSAVEAMPEPVSSVGP